MTDYPRLDGPPANAPVTGRYVRVRVRLAPKCVRTFWAIKPPQDPAKRTVRYVVCDKSGETDHDRGKHVEREVVLCMAENVLWERPAVLDCRYEELEVDEAQEGSR